MILNYVRGCVRKMSLSAPSVLTPVGVRGLTQLDRAKFLRTVQVPTITMRQEILGRVGMVFKPYVLRVDNFRPVQDTNDEDKKCIFLNPDIITAWTDFTEEDRSNLSEYEVGEDSFGTKEIDLNYDNWSYDVIFKAVLPEDEDVVSGFSQIGHVVHLNLKQHLLKYRYVIGQVLLDKIKTCKTVVNKTNIIDNTFRNFSMELVAGEEDYFVTVKENRCIFQFDFSKVYWNPRLCSEHERILQFLKPGDVMFDVFSGVGPFAIPAVKNKCKVYANDLNPESYKWLNHNAKGAKVNMENFKTYNLDGKDFICDVFKDWVIRHCQGTEKLQEGAKVHIVMNLPALAVGFLKYFNGLIVDEELMDNFDCEIIVYAYCFIIGEDAESIAKEMVIHHIGYDISEDILDIFDVRKVSPKKQMLRVTFKLTKEILFDYSSESSEEPPLKRACLEDEDSA